MPRCSWGFGFRLFGFANVGFHCVFPGVRVSCASGPNSAPILRSVRIVESRLTATVKSLRLRPPLDVALKLQITPAATAEALNIFQPL